MSALCEEAWRRVTKAADLVNSVKVSLEYVSNEVCEENEMEAIRCVSHVCSVALGEAFKMIDDVLEGVE